MDEKAAAFARKLMRDHHNYSQVVATFLSNPKDLQNNRELKVMEQSLELSI